MLKEKDTNISTFRKIAHNTLLFFPVVLSALLLVAHFKKAGLIPLVILSLLIPLSLFIRKNMVAKIVQIMLILGAIEWIRTTIVIINKRLANGEDWIRVAIILGTVAIFTFCSGMLFSWSRSLKKIYDIEK